MADQDLTATAHPDRAELAEACERLQQTLDAMLGTQEAEEAVGSLDSAVASLKEVEHHNVSSVQLVALADR
jgi:hypothetical protein